MNEKVKAWRGALLVWVPLVMLNSVIGLLVSFGEHKGFGERSGILAGVASFIVGYAWLDVWLTERGKVSLRSSLRISASGRMLIQFYPIVDFYAGAAAHEVVAQVARQGFFHTYLKTVVMGLELSVLMAAILGVIRLGTGAWAGKAKQDEVGQ